MSPDLNAHTDRVVRSLRNLMAIIALIGVVALGYIEKNRYDGCQRGKKDRVANAAAWNAQATYLDQVLLATSVKQDVKTAAKTAQTVERTSADDLTARSKISCSPF